MPKNFWDNLQKPIITLAPMDGYTDSAFRRVCKMVNPDIAVFTEFVPADGLYHKAKKLQEKFYFDKSEHPIIAQIFGKDTETFITAAKYCKEQGFDGVDINMGCPSKRVIKSEHGVALRKKPELAFKLVEAVAKATTLPVSVKTRLGWHSAEDLIDFGKGLQKAGARLITVHGRTYTQGYNHPADFEPIYKLKAHLSIPVIGNGDIRSIADGLEKLKNLDGFMIGRAAMGNPWVLSDKPIPSFEEKLPLIKKHFKLLFELKGEKVVMLEIRKHLLVYVKGMPNASKYRSQLAGIASREEIETTLNKITHDIQKEKSRPN